jgi:hypothetical protein
MGAHNETRRLQRYFSISGIGRGVGPAGSSCSGGLGLGVGGAVGFIDWLGDRSVTLV